MTTYLCTELVEILQLNGNSNKALLHVVKTKIYLMIVFRCFKIYNNGFLHKCIWYTQPVLYWFKFKEMHTRVVQK